MSLSLSDYYDGSSNMGVTPVFVRGGSADGGGIDSFLYQTLFFRALFCSSFPNPPGSNCDFLWTII